MTPHVLVVDDDAHFAESITAFLEAGGRASVVAVAANGREAVASALALAPDVVLMDVHMPVMDGLEATRLLRRSLPSARVVLMTGSSAPDEGRRARRAGAHAFLPKGVGYEALLEAACSLAGEGVGR